MTIPKYSGTAAILAFPNETNYLPRLLRGRLAWFCVGPYAPLEAATATKLYVPFYKNALLDPDRFSMVPSLPCSWYLFPMR